MIYFGNYFDFQNKSYIKKSNNENLKCLVLFHGLSFYLLEKEKNRGSPY